MINIDVNRCGDPAIGVKVTTGMLVTDEDEPPCKLVSSVWSALRVGSTFVKIP